MRSERSASKGRPFRAVRWLLAIALGTLLLALGASAEWGAEGQDRASLVRFSHQFHLNEAGAGCEDCHPGATGSTLSSDNLLARMDGCYECHDRDETACTFCHLETVEEERYTAFASPAREIQFDHSLHAARLEIDCATCHRGFDAVDLAGAEQMPAMAGCTDCHTSRQVTGECMLCHTDPTAPRPASHDEGFRLGHESLVRTGDQSCAACHGSNDCQECHDGDRLLVASELPDARFSPHAPTSGDVSQSHVLGRVHALDYGVTHALDARGKTSDCRACHEAQSFCVECHNPDDDPDRFLPPWHGGADWGALVGGVGTGGGRHAELARRDLERCVACHDSPGDDPTCLLCHRDVDGVRGTDPRTHEPGYMRNVQGRWHDDPGDLCFACHQTSRGQGTGFCSYCHGARD